MKAYSLLWLVEIQADPKSRLTTLIECEQVGLNAHGKITANIEVEKMRIYIGVDHLQHINANQSEVRNIYSFVITVLIIIQIRQ